MARSIVYASSCDEAAAVLGGYVCIDVALDATIQGLMVNPYAFPGIESDYYRSRYVVTKAVNEIPSLVWLFDIDEHNNVVLRHVEPYENY